jgi:hypothetical protein
MGHFMSENAEERLGQVLEKLSTAQVAEWGLFVLEPCFKFLRARYWWHPHAILLRVKTEGVLKTVAFDRSYSYPATVKKVEKVRQMSENHLGITSDFLWAYHSVLHFFSQFQIAFDSLDDPKSAGDLFAVLKEMPKDVARVKWAGLTAGDYMERCLQKAEEFIGRN